MLDCAGIDADPAEALASGKAMDAWKAMIRAQGGEGRGLAIAGIVLGIVGLVFGTLVMLFVLLAGVVRGSP